MKPHIVLLVLDSIRAESTSLFGCSDRTTPFLEEFAAEAVAYSNAISTCVSTVPAHASLFTGTNVSTHELYVDGDQLSPQFTTLAEALARDGYRTFGVCYQDDVSPATGLHRGFAQFDMEDEPSAVRRVIRRVAHTKNPIGPTPGETARATAAPGGIQTSAPPSWRDTPLYRRVLWSASQYSDQGAVSTERKAQRFLNTVQPSEPVFMYLHYDEAHLPYRPPVPFRYRFLSGPARRRAALVNQNRNRYFTGDAPMGPADFDTLLGLYHGAIAYLDEMVRRVVGLLKQRHMFDNTMLIVMGDHGDSIGEHGLLSHKFCVYDTLTRVPLIIKYPRGSVAVGRHDGIVQHTDLVPTVLDLAGLPASVLQQTVEGNSLVSSSVQNRQADIALSELIKPFGRESAHLRARMRQYDRRFFSVRNRTHKYIWASDGRHEAFDLITDPRETRNLLDDSRAAAAEVIPLRAIAERHLPKFLASYERNRHRM